MVRGTRRQRDDKACVRLRRGQQGSQGSAGWQGRQPRGDDQPRAARAARVHHHHRGLQGVPGQRARRRRSSPPRWTSTWPRCEQAMGHKLGDAERPAAGVGALGRQVLHAGHDGDRPQRRPQRRERPGPRGQGRRRRRRPAVRLGLVPAADPDVRQDRRATCRARRSSTRSTRPSRPSRPRATSASTRTTCRVWSTSSRRSSPSTPARSSRRSRASSCDLAIEAVFDSWNSDRAVLYRRQERIPADLGTAVNVVAMVFGNLGADSGTGVAFTRDPGTGAQGVYGDYLANAQGEDVVAGIRNTVSLDELEGLDKKSFDELMAIMATLEGHYRDLCDIEFTIERGKLWMLQTRVGKRTAAAAFVIATQLVDEGVIDLDEARRPGHRRAAGAADVPDVRPRQLRQADRQGHRRVAGRRRRARPSSTPRRAAEAAADGERVILVRRETNPDDLPGMIAAQGILTSRGGKTSHAAVVARGMGKTCVCGADAIDVNIATRAVHCGRCDGQGGRGHLDRRHQRQGLPRRGAGAAVRRRAVLRGRGRRGRRPADRRRAPAAQRTPTASGGSRCAPTPTPPRTRRGPAASAPRASVCAAPSTCSSATGASWSSG